MDRRSDNRAQVEGPLATKSPRSLAHLRERYLWARADDGSYGASVG